MLGFLNHICAIPNRYNILAPNASAGVADPNEASKKVIGSLDLDKDEYRFGTTKVKLWNDK